MLHGRVHAAESVQSVIGKALDLAALLSTCSCTEAFAFACCVVTMVMSSDVLETSCLGFSSRSMKLRQQKVQNISDHKFGETAEVCKGKRINASRYEQHKKF